MSNLKNYIFLLGSYTVWVLTTYQFFSKLLTSRYLGATGLLVLSFIIYLMLGFILIKNCKDDDLRVCHFIRRIHFFVIFIFLIAMYSTDSLTVINEGYGFLTGLMTGSMMLFYSPTKFAVNFLKWRKVDLDSLK
jgi:uncharacterized membrane protein YcgQ (UPF0703/DUF1980 family)